MTQPKQLQIQNSNQLLNLLWDLAGTNEKNWFTFHAQKIVKMNLAYEIAKLHAPVMSPEEVVSYVNKLNNDIYNTIVKG